ncbi:Ribosomal protein S16 [Candidatus Endolissoclinum faulkneri L2]|uniref:Small ribosomal subunit protein bS16 n=1 Tax=Candidatus Endolissoclinum faulkneri L2 TaxID=1193729 RepID=K7Z3M8_9PROT|nr:30S ribosomal protein S16 [Candidatus Endolissoclinum faulkneri]AFX98593.1 Ribosomal protein S16 [Candidatus Endolissoclinum faulkneri L2]
MALRIRLSRGGAKKRPFYRIVVAEATSPRDGRFVDKLGSYNPMLPLNHPNHLVINQDRLKYWLSVGAKTADRVHRMLARVGIMEPFVWNKQTKISLLYKKSAE